MVRIVTTTISNGNESIIADVERRTREREAWQAGGVA